MFVRKDQQYFWNYDMVLRIWYHEVNREGKLKFNIKAS